MSSIALIVIDMQSDFFLQQPRLAQQRRSLVASINELCRTFRQSECSIIWVRQEFSPDLSDAFLKMQRLGTRMTIAGTNGCQILAELEVDPRDIVIVKKRYSAFFGTILDSVLASICPGTVVIAGVNTHACIRMTAIDAYQRDYDVVLASECIGSYDDGHHEITKMYLARGMASVLTNPEIVGMLKS